MSYAGIMVYVEADDTPDQRVRLAANLADKFAATLIGLSALAIPPPVVADGMLMDGPTEVDIEMMKAKLVEKGNWFRSIAGADQRKVEWRFVLDFPNQALAREARSADLIVIGRMKAPGGAYNSLDPGGAILKMGRPTLVAAERVSSLRAEHVLIGWKDTRDERDVGNGFMHLLHQQTRTPLPGNNWTLDFGNGPRKRPLASVRRQISHAGHDRGRDHDEKSDDHRTSCRAVSEVAPRREPHQSSNVLEDEARASYEVDELSILWSDKSPHDA